MKPPKQLPRIVVFGIGCLVALAALLALAPQAVLQEFFRRRRAEAAKSGSSNDNGEGK